MISDIHLNSTPLFSARPPLSPPAGPPTCHTQIAALDILLKTIWFCYFHMLVNFEDNLKKIKNLVSAQRRGILRSLADLICAQDKAVFDLLEVEFRAAYGTLAPDIVKYYDDNWATSSKR